MTGERTITLELGDPLAGGHVQLRATLTGPDGHVIGFAGTTRTTAVKLIGLAVYDGAVWGRATCCPRELADKLNDEIAGVSSRGRAGGLVEDQRGARRLPPIRLCDLPGGEA